MTTARKIILAAGILALGVALAKILWDTGRVALAFGLIFLAASRSIDRNVALRSGYRMIPQAREIDELLGPAEHSVANEGDETDEGVKEEWISDVYFGSRYELVMTVGIRVDRRSSRVSKVLGPPSFILHEIRSVEMSLGGPADLMYGDQRQFSATDWEAVVRSKGDFSVIGVEIKNDPPIPNFGELKKEARSRASQQSAR